MQLEASRDRLLPRIDEAADTPGNREAINHWVGIERWSLDRIRVAQGAPFNAGGYHPYRLPETASLIELQGAFRDARAETLELARQLQRDGFDPSLNIRHNDLGELTVPEWFEYIDNHTVREIVRLRGRS